MSIFIPYGIPEFIPQGGTTHLLEQGLNIVTLRDLLDHADISTTMIYLHVAQCQHINPHSPLETLYGKALQKQA